MAKRNQSAVAKKTDKPVAQAAEVVKVPPLPFQGIRDNMDDLLHLPGMLADVAEAKQTTAAIEIQQGVKSLGWTVETFKEVTEAIETTLRAKKKDFNAARGTEYASRWHDAEFAEMFARVEWSPVKDKDGNVIGKMATFGPVIYRLYNDGSTNVKYSPYYNTLYAVWFTLAMTDAKKAFKLVNKPAIELAQELRKIDNAKPRNHANQATSGNSANDETGNGAGAQSDIPADLPAEVLRAVNAVTSVRNALIELQHLASKDVGLLEAITAECHTMVKTILALKVKADK